MTINTTDYRNAPSGIGPHAFTWKDKPHRLVYDLCRAIDAMRAAFAPLVDIGALEPGDHGRDQLLRVTDTELSLACQAYHAAGGCAKWSAEWPKEPGIYWAYGFPLGKSKHRQEPMLALCEVKHIGPPDKPSLVYQVHGTLAWEKHAGPTVFTPAVVPSTPDPGVLT